MHHALRTIRVTVLLATWLSTASASDWYVDAAAGSNANTGTSPGQAWQTITHALASTPERDAQTIHVAPGTYDVALGEVFPWSWRPALALVGDQGGATPIVVGAAGLPVIQMEHYVTSTIGAFGNDTLIQGIRFEGGTSAIEILTNWGAVSPTLADLEIVGTSSAGIDVTSYGFAGGGFPVLQNVAVSSCAVGMYLGSGNQGEVDVSATDCSFSESAGEGIVCSSGQSVSLSLERCRIEGSGGFGLVCGGSNVASVGVTMHATTIAHNQGGIWGKTGFSFGSMTVATQCTIADNGSVGVRMDAASGSTTTAQLDSTIVHGHLDDLAIATYGQGSTVAYCEIGDGELAGTAGNFQADPLFVNAPAGDYHLLGESPCIDAGNPALGIEADCSLPDVGAYPFTHPQSQTYCTAKLNSCGALPAIGAVGAPSATATSGYVVSASGTKALAAGILLYSTGGSAATPFQGGILCLAAPVRRTVLVFDVSGTPPQCNGVLALDMNAFAAGTLGGNPSPALLVPGTRVDCQYWGRDNPGALLSDALEYFVCP